jgi:hypothetical protein
MAESAFERGAPWLTLRQATPYLLSQCPYVADFGLRHTAQGCERLCCGGRWSRYSPLPGTKEIRTVPAGTPKAGTSNNPLPQSSIAISRAIVPRLLPVVVLDIKPPARASRLATPLLSSVFSLQSPDDPEPLRPFSSFYLRSGSTTLRPSSGSSSYLCLLSLSL